MPPTWQDHLLIVHLGLLDSNHTYLGCLLFQGQALAKVNIGNVLDSCGDWAGALQAYEEGYR